jgi:hypothetical protein
LAKHQAFDALGVNGWARLGAEKNERDGHQCKQLNDQKSRYFEAQYAGGSGFHTLY